MTRNKHFRSVFAALLCAVLCMTAFATVAYADGGDYYDDELPPETWQEETQPEDNTIGPRYSVHRGRHRCDPRSSL